MDGWVEYCSNMVSSQKDKQRCKSFVTTWKNFLWLSHDHRVVFDSEHKNIWNLEILVYVVVPRVYFPGIQPDRLDKKHKNVGQDSMTTLHRFQPCTRNLGEGCGVVIKLRTGRPRNRSSILSEGKRFLSSPKRPHRLWGTQSLLFNGYEGSLPGCKAAEAWNSPLTHTHTHTHTHLVPRLRIRRDIHPFHNTPSWLAQGQLQVRFFYY